MVSAEPPPELVLLRKSPDALLARVMGVWRTSGTLPAVAQVREALGEGERVKALEFDVASLGAWDSRFVAFISKCHALCRERNLEFRDAGLPPGVQRLLKLSETVPEVKGARPVPSPPSLLATVGAGAVYIWSEGRSLLTFLGEIVLAAVRLMQGRAQFRWSDAFLVMQQTGPQALGIVALINFLIGLILAFVGATTLARFGASVYVADMVAIGTVREMGCIMTGIILCGRTGAAFAAQLGTMKVNEEIGALTTFGISPIEFLVLPRMIALMLMMPLLCVFADMISIAGGLFVSVGMLDLSATEYLQRTVHAVKLSSFLLGIGKGAFFGFLIAFTGCLRGMQCGTNAAAVGEAATRAVVAGITAIIAFDGIFAVICNALNL